MMGRDFEWDYAEDITPDDSNDLTKYPIGIHVKTTAGLVNVDFVREKDDGDGTTSVVTEDVYIAQVGK